MTRKGIERGEKSEMKIGLVDVDGRVIRGKSRNGERYPNLVLMKLSAWHKAKGDNVEFAMPLVKYDRIYMSKIFTTSPDERTAWLCDDVRRGGTGYGVTAKDRLPEEVEHMRPDYSLYGVADTAYGFLTRGCPRGCPFCVVTEKEGYASQKVADLKEWWNGQKEIKLLDPNILACSKWRELFGQLIESRAKIDFTQGLDIRLMTEEKAKMIVACKVKMLHFAWDGKEDLEERFKVYAERFKHLRSGHRLRAYMITNFDTTHEWDMHRVRVLDSLGYDPFVMVYDKKNAPLITRRLQRWVNNKAVFRTVKKFKDYK